MPRISVRPPLAGSPRLTGTKTDLIVLHATAGGTARSSIEYLRRVGNSYHFIVERNGDIYECVAPELRAHHVGSGFGPHGHGVNQHSIGICAANNQQGELYLPAQVQAIHDLCMEMKRQFSSIRWVTTHAILQPWNRQDPIGWDLMGTAASLSLSPWIQGHVPAGERQPPSMISALVGGRTYKAWLLDGRSWAKLGEVARAAGVTVKSHSQSLARLRFGGRSPLVSVVSMGAEGSLVKLADIAAVKGVQAQWDPALRRVTIP